MATTSTITSKEGITWNFINPVSYGQYITGDYWVLGPALVSSISPSTTLRSDGTAKNGTMFCHNLSSSYQGLDAAVLLDYPYLSSMNVANYISSSLPLILNPGDRIVSVSSNTSAPAIGKASILTCVSSTTYLDASSFRPGYTDRSIDYIDGNALSSITSKLGNFDLTQVLTKTEPAVSALVSSVSSTWFDPFLGSNGRFIRPVGAMPLDDSLIAGVISNAALALNYYRTGLNKLTLAIYLTQIGIDAYSDLVNLNLKWATIGPAGSGKKFCILFAGAMLGNQDYLDVGSDYQVSYGAENVFPEDTQTFFVSSIGNSINYGNGGYSASDVGLPEWGLTHWNDSAFDTSSWVNTTSYGSDFRRFFSMKHWVGYIFASKIMGLQSFWNHDPLFYYFNRYYAKEAELISTLSSTNVKEALAPSGMEWQYDFVSGMNSFYFLTDSSSRVSGVGFHGISDNATRLLYASAAPSNDGVRLIVANPLNSSGVVLAGTPKLANFTNAASNTSSILYINNQYSVQENVSVSAVNFIAYDIVLPVDDLYTQVVWYNTSGQTIASTNALRIRKNVSY